MTYTLRSYAGIFSFKSISYFLKQIYLISWWFLKVSGVIMKQNNGKLYDMGACAVKEKYEQPMIRILVFDTTDVVTASVLEDDNLLDDSYFD